MSGSRLVSGNEHQIEWVPRHTGYARSSAKMRHACCVVVGLGEWRSCEGGAQPVSYSLAHSLAHSPTESRPLTHTLTYSLAQQRRDAVAGLGNVGDGYQDRNGLFFLWLWGEGSVMFYRRWWRVWVWLSGWSEGVCCGGIGICWCLDLPA